MLRKLKDLDTVQCAGCSELVVNQDTMKVVISHKEYKILALMFLCYLCFKKIADVDERDEVIKSIKQHLKKVEKFTKRIRDKAENCLNN